MATILKLFLFCLFVYGMIIGFYRLYKALNARIIGANTMAGVAGYALLLICANLVLFFGGIVLFYQLYHFLSL